MPVQRLGEDTHERLREIVADETVADPDDLASDQLLNHALRVAEFCRAARHDAERDRAELKAENQQLREVIRQAPRASLPSEGDDDSVYLSPGSGTSDDSPGLGR